MANQRKDRSRRDFVTISAKVLAGVTAATISLPAESNAKSLETNVIQRRFVEITRYALEWNPRANRGRVFFQLKTGKRLTLNLTSLSENASLTAVVYSLI